MPPHCALVGSLCASTDINVRCFCTTSFVYKTNHHLQSPGILVTKYSKKSELMVSWNGTRWILSDKGTSKNDMLLVIPKNAATDGQRCNGGTHILNAHPFSIVVGRRYIIVPEYNVVHHVIKSSLVHHGSWCSVMVHHTTPLGHPWSWRLQLPLFVTGIHKLCPTSVGASPEWIRHN